MVKMQLYNMEAKELPTQRYSGGEILGVNPQYERAAQMDVTGDRDGTLRVEFVAYTKEGAELGAALYQEVKAAMVERFGDGSIRQ